ncbi:MAG: hypothetical protein LBV74_11000 [Tannerella sp.]|jgi:hypothetical protein|nr:hypothetical protein [Tannerella sp.]
MKKSSCFCIGLLFFIVLIVVASGVFLFGCSNCWSTLLIKGCVFVFLTISLLCFSYFLFAKVKEIELTELKIKEKKDDLENKKDWERFVYVLNKEKKTVDDLRQENETLKSEKDQVEQELGKLKGINKDIYLEHEEQIMQIYAYALLGSGGTPSAEEIKKKLEEANKSYQEIKKIMKNNKNLNL